MIAFEEWRSCPDYEGIYEVSSIGRVRRIGVASGARLGRILAQTLSADGYPLVNLSAGNQSRSCRVHQLVCRAFIGERPPDGEVNHLDGNKANNRVANLEWTTRLGNAQHAARTGLYLRGPSAPNAKLTEADVLEIRMLRGVASQRAIAKRFGLAQCTVKRIQLRQSWRHVA